MNCPSRAVDDDAIHAYVAGKLPEHEADAFELHLLGCGECRAAVGLGAGIRSALVERAGRSRRRRLAGVTATVFALAAASVAIAVVRRSGSGDSLEAFKPPVFSGFAVRSAVDADSARATVDRGMAAYQRNDFETAARLLEEGARLDASPGVSFYLAVSQLARDDAASALRAAQRAATSPRGNPFATDAAIVAAKAWLRMGQPDSAAVELARAPRDDPRSGHAAALLDSVRRLRR